jgi:hypothetical protein
MSLAQLMKEIADDEQKQLKKQENNMPEPKKEVEDSSNENVAVDNEEELGSDTSKDTTVSNENETDVNKPSETSKDDKGVKPVKKQELTMQQKQEYAFRKQFGIQEKKHREAIEALKQQIEEIKKINSKTPELKQSNFDTIEEWEDYKDQQRTEKIKEDLRKEELQRLEQQEELHHKANEISSRVNELIPDKQDRELYNNMVKQAVDLGIDDFLNKENKGPIIKSFIADSQIGPLVLQHLLGYPEELERIYKLTDVTDKKLELKLIERDIKQSVMFKRQQQSQNQTSVKQEKTNIPVLGKLGTQGTNNSNVKLSKVEEDNEVLRFMRGR